MAEKGTRTLDAFLRNIAALVTAYVLATDGAFKAQRITDEAGLLACAMYVDLNPVRAAMALSPGESPHTSAYDRIQAEQGAQIASAAFDLVAIEQAEVAKQRTKLPSTNCVSNDKPNYAIQPDVPYFVMAGWLH